MNASSLKRFIHFFLEAVAFAELYILGAELGLYIASFNPKEPSPIWPSEGIVLSLLILFGYRVVPGAFLGGSIANYIYHPDISTALIAGLGNTLGTVLNFFIIRRWVKKDYPLYSGKVVGYFFTLSTYPGAFLASVIGVSALYFWDVIPEDRYWIALLSWFISKELGFVIVTPFILSLIFTRKDYSWSFRSTSLGVLSIVLMVLTSRYAFISSEPILVLPIPFLIYASVRFRDIGATTSVVLVTILASYYTIRGYGPFANLEHKWKSIAPLIYLDSYIVALTGVSYTLVAVLKERERAQKKAIANMKKIELIQENAKRELEKKVIERTKIIEQQKNELENQILMAQKIQLALLPQKIPQISNLEIAFEYLPMMKVGGDFLDIRKFNNPKGLSFFICDVSGHGVASAFLSAMIKMSLYHWYENPKNLNRAAHELFLSLSEAIGSNFVTASFLFYDLETQVLNFARAGHLPLIIIRKDKSIEQFSPRGRVVMSLAPPECEEIFIQLQNGEMVVLYTDGIIEARNPNSQKMYSLENFIDFIQKNSHLGPSELSKKIIESCVEYSGGIQHLEDDLSVLCFKV